MKPHFFYWIKKRGSLLTLGLVAVLAASACAPAAATNPPQTVEPIVPATSLPAVEVIPSATGEAVATQAAEVVQPVATSRGPNLEATDPATVALASGGLQLVEFFRFT